MKYQSKTGFTLIELLVVVSIIALLIGILLPAINKARDQALQTRSAANLRQLATAHASYATEWNDNQWTNTPHNIAVYGQTANAAFSEYIESIGGLSSPMVFNNQGTPHLRTWLGWGVDPESGTTGMWFYGHNVYMMPINFDNSLAANFEGFGWFRMINVHTFNQYVGGRFYDPVFYAPKDEIPITAIAECWDDPHEFCTGSTPYSYWSSYVLSPAALFASAMWTEPQNEFVQTQDEIFERYPGALRTPRYSQARYPDLKTHMIEHHWLQNRRAECNENIPAPAGTYDGCTPYYFNHGMESVPQAMFYDGHVAGLGVREVIEADTRLRSQMYPDLNFIPDDLNGLWRRDTPFDVDGDRNGYFEELAWGHHFSTTPQTSFHILTNDGILGRDTLPRGR